MPDRELLSDRSALRSRISFLEGIDAGGMLGIKKHDHAVEEAAAVTGCALEAEPVHGGREPDHAQQARSGPPAERCASPSIITERVLRCRFAVIARLPAVPTCMSPAGVTSHGRRLAPTVDQHILIKANWRSIVIPIGSTLLVDVFQVSPCCGRGPEPDSRTSPRLLFNPRPGTSSDRLARRLVLPAPLAPDQRHKRPRRFHAAREGAKQCTFSDFSSFQTPHKSLHQNRTSGQLLA